MATRLLVPMGLMLCAACAGEKPAAQAPAAATPATPEGAATAVAAAAQEIMVRGTVFGFGDLTFRACDGSTLVPALDSTGGRLMPTYRFLRPPDEEGMYVIARAAQSPGGAIVFRELQFARRPVAGENCDQPAPDYILLARGINPGWRVTISASGIEFAQDSEPKTISFPAATPDDSGGMTRYQASADVHTLHLMLTSTSCNEGNVGVYAAMQAALILDGRTLSGCAWMGRLP